MDYIHHRGHAGPSGISHAMHQFPPEKAHQPLLSELVHQLKRKKRKSKLGAIFRRSNYGCAYSDVPNNRTPLLINFDKFFLPPRLFFNTNEK